MKNLTQSKVVTGHCIDTALPGKWKIAGFSNHFQNKQMIHILVLNSDSNSKTGLGNLQVKCSLKSVLSCQTMYPLTMGVECVHFSG